MNFYNPYNNNPNNIYGNNFYKTPMQNTMPQQTNFLAPMNNIQLASLPAPTTATPATASAVQLSAEVENSTSPKTTRVVTNTTKEVISHE